MSDVLNKQELWSRLENDRDLLASLVDVFKRRSEVVLLSLQEHLRSKDAQALSQAAHQLAGMLANLSAIRALPIARELERRSRDGDLENATARCQQLQTEVHAVAQALSVLVDAEPAAEPAE